MDSKPPVQRKAYRKPDISRVDLVEDEVALQACKAPTRSVINSKNVIGYAKCKIGCKVVSAS